MLNEKTGTTAQEGGSLLGALFPRLPVNQSRQTAFYCAFLLHDMHIRGNVCYTAPAQHVLVRTRDNRAVFWATAGGFTQIRRNVNLCLVSRP